MHIAAKNGQIDCLLELKKLGADITLENNGHESVFDFLKHYEVEIPKKAFFELFTEDSSTSSDQEDFIIKVTGDFVEVC